MSESDQSAEGAGSNSGPDTSGLAVELALEEARNNPQHAAKVDTFLGRHIELVDIQKHHLNEQFKHLEAQFKTLRLGLWEKRLGVLLRVATAFTGLAIAAGLAFLVWQAAHSKELVVNSFSVPPDMAARGLNGEAIAADMVNSLAKLSAQTTASRSPDTFVNNFENKIKLEIPETGISLFEFDNFLREKLGHDTHVTGNVVKTPAGIKLTVHAGSFGSASVSGPEEQLDSLLLQLSEKLYEITQPYRYAVYLLGHNRGAEAAAILRQLTNTTEPTERAWAHYGLGVYQTDQADWAVSQQSHEAAAKIDPEFFAPVALLSNFALPQLRNPERQGRDIERAQRLLASHGRDKIRLDYIPVWQALLRSGTARLAGDFREAVANGDFVVRSGIPAYPNAFALLALSYVGQHDIVSARAVIATGQLGNTSAPGHGAFLKGWAILQIDKERQDWASIIRDAQSLSTLSEQYPGVRRYLLLFVGPAVAYAKAQQGRFAEAEKDISSTPGDCYPCLIARAQIAAMQGQRARADYWFDRAVKAGPSIPFAHAEWGQSLMQRGDLTGAIAKFKLANQKGPHFADPLEMWGEVLIAQNRSDLAIAKFTEANKYAPNWGRLHLKWGEALLWTGKTAEAQKQFELAASLDLTAAEKTELAKVSGHR